MRKQNSSFEAKFISEEGSKLKNNDYFGYVELDGFACYVIADGITDMPDAEGARLAIETIILNFQAAPSISKRSVRKLLKLANRALLARESYKQLKASVTVVVTNYQKLRYGYAGNTRLRLYRGGIVYKQTKDMSLSQSMAEQEEIPKDEVMRHEERNNLYSYLGKNDFRPVISKKIKLLETDMIALYTRGIWENVDEAEMDDVFAEADNQSQETIDSIEDLLLSRQPEKLDNYTLAVIFVNKVYQNPERRKRIQKIIIISVAVVVIIAVICVVVWFLYRKRQQRIEDMNYYFTNTVEYVNTDNYVRAQEECTQAQELAKKLRDDAMKNRLQEYLVVIETVLLADESYVGGAYEEANEYYLSAMDRARYADNIGTDYMEKKLNKISIFLSVEDDIALGDALLERGDYEGAEEKYLLAKSSALSVHDAEGKQNAMDALEKLYQEKESAESEAQEAADDRAKEQVAAAEMIAAGDKACLEQDYTGAKVYYTMAAAKYEEMEDTALADTAKEKLAAVEEKLAEQEEKKNAAGAYEAQGLAGRQSGDLWGAKSQYMSAKSVYQELGSDEDVQRITDILAEIDVQIAQTVG